MIRLLIISALSAVAIAPVQAADRETAFSQLIERSIQSFIKPGYKRFADETEHMHAGISSLCRTPSPSRLEAAKRQFASLVNAWGSIDLIRFGPISEKHRYERIFYWPDHKGIGHRQIRRLLRNAEPSVLEPDNLRKKSVAVQGIRALEIVLFTGKAEALASGGEPYRCAYAQALTLSLRNTARAVFAEWTDDAPFPKELTNPGPNGANFRNREETVQAVLLAITSQLLDTRNAKIRAVLGESPQRAKPRKAPFHRSGLTLNYLKANISSAHRLFEVAGFLDALSDNDRWLAGSVRFEFAGALKALTGFSDLNEKTVRDAKNRQIWKRIDIHLTGAATTIGDYYAERTGLTLGFNSRDGD